MTGLGGARLIRRGLREARGISALLALLVAAGALLAVGAPRQLDHILTTALHADLARTGTGPLALEALVPQDEVPTPDGGAVAPVWNGIARRLDAVHRRLSGLGEIVGPGAYVGQAGGTGVQGFVGGGTATAASNARFRFVVEAAPGLRGDARLVSGAWPGPWVEGKPIQVVMSAEGAAAMKWRVGQVQTLRLSIPEPAVLVGTVSPRDPSSTFWSLESQRSVAGVQPSADGTFLTYRSTVWIDPTTWPDISQLLPGHLLVAWYPVDARAIGTDTAGEVASAIRHFAVDPSPLGIEGTDASLTFRTELPAAIADFQARAAPPAALITLFLLGPAGAFVAVLLLGLRLLAARRAVARELLRARGASGWQLRAILTSEVAAWTVPAALMGAGVAILLVPGGGPVAASLGPAALGLLAAPVAAIALGGPASPSESAPARRTVRVVVECVAVAIAGLAAVLLVARGPDSAPQGATGQADLLLESAPLLIAVAVTLLLLRLGPAAGRRLAGLLRGGAAAIGLVAASSLGGRRAGAALTLFALVVGVGMSTFSLTMVATQQHGAQQAAVNRVGADLAVHSSLLTKKQIAALRELRGVTAGAVISVAGQQPVGNAPVAIYTVDPAELAAAQSDIDASPLAAVRGSSALVGGIDSPPATLSLEGSNRVTVMLRAVDQGSVSKVLTEPQWVLVDRARLPHTAAIPVAMLLRLSPGADPDTAARDATRVVGAGATVSTAAGAELAFLGTPLDAGVHAAILVATAASAVLCLAVFAVALAAGAEDRQRRNAILRALGFDRRQTGALAVLELAPMAVAGVVAGTLTGIGIAALVLVTIDPTGFVGQTSAPSLVVDPITTSATVAGFLLAALLAVCAAAFHDRSRSSTTGVHTLGEER